ncbi:MAG: ketopantoate reductase family protein [Oscillibacter sp.]
MGKIQTVGIIGVGALGVLYADLFTRALGRERVCVLADKARVERYTREGIYLNDARCDFRYVDAATAAEPVDLLLFAVKFGGLNAAVETCRHLVGPETIVLSVLNGIASEQVLGEAFGFDAVVWCVAQKMSALKVGNRAVCHQPGELAVGLPQGRDSARLRALTAFWDEIHFPYSLPADIQTHMWSKLLCNTGCNQAAMVYECGYAGLQQPGPARDTMLAAMGEVVTVANAQGIPLSEADVTTWTDIIDHFDPAGEPSMRQDGKAHRKSEVELFSGTIRRLAQQHGISVPVNEFLYQRVQEMESRY